MKYYEKLLIRGISFKLWDCKLKSSDVFYLDEENCQPVICRGGHITYAIEDFEQFIEWGNKLFEEVEDE